MAELRTHLQLINDQAYNDMIEVVADIQHSLLDANYETVELNDQKPWGAYFRINGGQAERFIEEFFPGLTADEARLGIKGAELSPKILLVKPGQRLSWQYHDRRAERWMFLTSGAYNKSQTDDEGEVFIASAGEAVQFQRGERHRLIGADDIYTIVAEIWQHSDPAHPSDEDDIVRLADDYQR
jgi:mannose-6-phosphate isomerase